MPNNMGTKVIHLRGACATCAKEVNATRTIVRDERTGRIMLVRVRCNVCNGELRDVGQQG